MSEKKDNKNSKSFITFVISVLAIVLLLIGLLLIILEETVNIFVTTGVRKIVEAAQAFFNNPTEVVQWETIKQSFSSFIPESDSEFDPTDYETNRPNVSVVIEKSVYNGIKEELNKDVELSTIGLEDYLLKKMFVSYYRTSYLYGTNILVELTEEEANKLLSNPNTGKNLDEKAFNVIDGDEAAGIGKNGCKYLQSKGTIGIHKDDEELIYYPEDVLNEIYTKHYLNAKDINPDYASDVINYLAKCFTYGENGGIKVYSKSSMITEETALYYENLGQTFKVTDSISGELQLEEIDLKEKIYKYTVPMEFMVQLLTVTGSPDFLDAFLDVANENMLIELNLVENQCSETEEAVVEGTRKMVVVAAGKTAEDISKIKETYTKTAIETKSELLVAKVSTWYGLLKNNINFSNNEIITTTTATGEEKEIENTNEYVIRNLPDKKQQFDSNNQSDVFTTNSSNINTTVFANENQLYNKLFNYVISKSESGNGSTSYNFTNMEVTDSNLTSHTAKTKKESGYSETTEVRINNTNSFLGLLVNENGEYEFGADYKSKESGGIPVAYDNIYGGQSEVGELLVNGSDVIYESLEKSEDTEELSGVMQYILEEYSDNPISSGVTKLILDGEVFREIAGTITGGVQDFWNEIQGKLPGKQEEPEEPSEPIAMPEGFLWPIGSSNTAKINGKLFAYDPPTYTVITSGVGPRWGTNHGGIDIAQLKKDSTVPGPYVIASDSGTVTVKARNYPDNGSLNNNDGGGFGNWVTIDHGNGYVTYYAHMAQNSIIVNTGDVVEKGQVIGQVGHSGQSTGAHLHFEIRIGTQKSGRQDPEKFVDPNQERKMTIKEENKEPDKSKDNGKTEIPQPNPNAGSDSGKIELPTIPSNNDKGKTPAVGNTPGKNNRRTKYIIR